MNSKKKLGIIGSGDLGQLIAHHALINCGFNEVLFFDDFKSPKDIVNNNIVYGGIKDIEKAFNNNEISHIIIAVGYKHMEFRKTLFKQFSGKIPFASIIHPSSSIDRSCKLGEGIVVLPGCILDMNVEISDNVLLNTGCVISHDSTIKAHSFLSPRVAVAGFVEIGEGCIIGINTTIIDNIQINDFVQTGGGTVVIKNLIERGLYVGNPARFIK
jgi:sugar O-acyltransferase (sialic acid O-acetyltransferase NeuD family)